MHTPRQFWLSCLVAVLSLVGCANGNRTQVTSVKRVYIENTKSSNHSTAELLTPTALETIAIELTRHGYVVVSSKNLAEGVLRMSWQTGATNASNTTLETPISLSMTLFNQKGKRIFSGSSGSGVQAAYWSQARTQNEIVSILKSLPAAVVASN